MIDPRYLRGLLTKYAIPVNESNPDTLADVVRKYQEFKQTNLLDCAAIATSLTVEQLMGDVHDPLVRKAVEMASPNFDLDAFHTKEEWMGLLNTVKGKYFELLVVEKLNAGQQVGDVLLPQGFHAKLAELSNQPGWDIEIHDSHDHISSYLQMKASDSTSYIREALERYPDIKILATSEVADHLGNTQMVLDAGISEQQLRDTVQLAVGYNDNLLGAFWDNFHPIIPLLIIASTQGYLLIVGKATARDAIEVGLARSTRALVMTVTAGTVNVMGGGLIAIPAAWLAGSWFTRMQSIGALIERSRHDSQKFAAQAKHYRHDFAVAGVAR